MKSYQSGLRTPTIFLPALLLFFATAFAYSGEPLSISKDFTMFTSKNLAGYTKPLFTTIGQSFNSNNYTRAIYPDHWQIAVDISAMGMFIPNSQLQYDAELPDQYGNTDVTETVVIGDNHSSKGLRYNVGGTIKEPTIYGKESYAVYAAPQNHYYPDSTYKSVAFAEGNDIGFMMGVPIFQFVFGFPTRTQLRLRTWGAPVQDEFMLYYGIILNQQVDHFFDLFQEEDQMGLALNLGYHNMSRNPGLSVSSFQVGAHFSKAWESGLAGYAGFQYEGFGGEFHGVKDKKSVRPGDMANSPYAEIRNYEDLKFDIESFTSFRILAGVSYKVSIFEFHFDFAYASQPQLAFGITFWFANIGEKERVTKIEKIERHEKIERIEKREE